MPVNKHNIDTDALEREYRILYWNHNELQIIRADYPSEYIDRKIKTSELSMRSIENVLGYVPAP